MEIRKLNSISKLLKASLFICWIGLSYELILAYNFSMQLNYVEIIAYLASKIDVFSNLRGGQPVDPTDFVM